MTRGFRIATLSAVLGALWLAGCGADNGSSCPTSSAQIADAPSSCQAVRPGGRVRVQLGVCQECYESSPTCSVDAQGNAILLDTLVESCQDASSCSTAKSCSPTVVCDVIAPSAEGSYSLQAADLAPGVTLPAIVVSGSGAASVTCL